MNALASFVVRRARLTVVLWALLAAVSALGAAQLHDRLANGGFTVPGSQSERAEDLVRARVNGGDRSGVLVTARPDMGRPLDARLRRALASAPGVERVGPPRLAAGGGLVAFQVELGSDLARAQKRLPELRQRAAAAAGEDRATSVVGAPAVFERYSELAREDLKRVELLSFPVTAVIILVAFLSVFATGIPLVLAGLGLLISLGVLYLVSLLADISVFATNTALVLGLGLSIDYALFNVTRFREELRERGDVPAAVRATVVTTGRAIVFSGLTVTGAVGSLLLIDIGVFSGMALGAMAAALVSVAGGVTLVPALLTLLGKRVDRLALAPAQRAARSGRLWTWLASFAVRRRVPIVVSLLPLLLIAAIPLREAGIGFPTSSALPPDDPTRAAEERLGRAFGAGAAQPVSVVARGDARRLVAVLRDDPGVGRPLAVDRGERRWLEISAPLRAPPDSERAQRTVRRLRARLTEGVAPLAVAVGGPTASGIDIVERLNARTPLVVAFAAGFTFLLLLLAFRSIVAPLKAVLTVLLSVAAALGILTLLYSSGGLGTTDELSYFVPLFLFGIVFGLSTDYEVFLLSRIRESHMKGRSTNAAIAEGLVASARSISLAGLVMIVVFLAQGTSRMEPLQQLGIGMALAVLIDVTLVRTLLVPASMALLGRLNWWLPRRMGGL